MNRVRFTSVTICLILALLVLIPLQFCAQRLKLSLSKVIPIWFHKIVLWTCGCRVLVEGTPPGSEPILVIANHTSWLDIPIIGSLRPLSFIAKAEVKYWFGISFLSQLQGTVFLDRSKKSDTVKVNIAVAQKLEKNEMVVLFPEGTTGNGTHLLPFRSSIIGAAQLALSGSQLKNITLQPLAIRYTQRNGLPLSRCSLPEVAWYGNVGFGTHAFSLMGNGTLDVVVIWGEPISLQKGMDRKIATFKAEKAVRMALGK